MGFVPVTIVLSQLDRPRRRRRRRCCRKEHVKIELDLRLNSLVYIIRYANLSRRIRQTKLTRKVTLKYVHCHSFEMESVARSFAF